METFLVRNNDNNNIDYSFNEKIISIKNEIIIDNKIILKYFSFDKEKQKLLDENFEKIKFNKITYKECIDNNLKIKNKWNIDELSNQMQHSQCK